MESIGNDYPTFVYMWRLIRRTHRSFHDRHKLFCPRRILQEWLPELATDEFILEVCDRAGVSGFTLLPHPALDPVPCRELIRGVLSMVLDTGVRKLRLPLLDKAYSEVYPNSYPINVNKMGRPEYGKKNNRKKNNRKKNQAVWSRAESPEAPSPGQRPG